MLSAARGLGCPQAKAGSISILSVPFSRSSFKSRLRILEYSHLALRLQALGWEFGESRWKVDGKSLKSQFGSQ